MCLPKSMIYIIWIKGVLFYVLLSNIGNDWNLRMYFWKWFLKMWNEKAFGLVISNISIVWLCLQFCVKSLDFTWTFKLFSCFGYEFTEMFNKIRSLRISVQEQWNVKKDKWTYPKGYSFTLICHFLFLLTLKFLKLMHV